MHPISDKELDKLFQQRFEDLQVEPSNQVWEKISNSLDNKKPDRKSFSIFWTAAASVIVVLSAGLWFTKPDQKNPLQESPAILNNNSLGLTQLPIIEDVKQPALAEVKQVSIASAIVEFSVDESLKMDPKLVNQPLLVLTESKPQEEQATLIMASNTTAKSISSQSKQPIAVPPRYSSDQSTPALSQPDMINSISKQASSFFEDDRSSARNKKVRGIGGLVNFVIAQVDKREDKLIEFTESDEGTEISGINLGILSIKSRK
jgi:hypothetical protein